jgi:crotonobetainyl-CoA:carnitine CoA-transferase CaiB-like acyl-CoA transferase
MGYGPLVRASTGLSPLWSYPGEGGDGFSDGITIYPDHVASRFVAIAVMALLIRREKTGRGGTVSVAQTDVVLAQMADRIMAESIRPGAIAVAGNSREGDAPRGIFPCAGDDEWCVIDVRGDAEFRALAEVVGEASWLSDDGFASAGGRLAHARAIHERVRSWTSGRAPREAVARLQERGVAAGFMQRPTEFAQDPHFVARGFLRLQAQPQFDDALLSQNGEAVFSSMGTPLSGPAPIHGEHTVTVCAEVLGMSDSEIAELIESGVLEVPPATIPDS